MATDIRALPAFVDTDARFRAWVQGIEAQLVAAGLVVTADTGQIDPTTVAKPVGGTVMAGYRMYRFADALQATKPVFIKVFYGNASLTNGMGMTVQVGTATNGAGGFTGVTVSASRTIFWSAIKASGDSLNSYCSGSQAEAGGGRVSLVNNLDPASSNFSIGFHVERLKNGDGTPHASGAFWFAALSSFASNQIWSQILVQGLVPGSTASGVLPALPLVEGVNNVPAVGTDLALAPLMFTYGVWLYAYPLLYRNTDISVLTPFTMTHLGALHTFMTMGANVSSLALGYSGTGQGLAIPWE